MNTLGIVATLWTIYGFGLNDMALVVTNTIVGILALTIVVTKILDRD